MTASRSGNARHDEALQQLDDPHVEAFGMLTEAYTELHHAVTTRLVDAVSVPPAWLGVLIRLARSPEHRLRMSELARDMTMSSSGLPRLVDRIEAAGHLRREACPEDRRGLWAVLTDDGRAVVTTAAPTHVADLRQLFGALDLAEIETLTDLLRSVRDQVRGGAGGH